MDAPTPAGKALRREKREKGRGGVHRETCYHPQNASKVGNNKVLYFTHVHKSGGTTMCGLAKRHHCLVNAVDQGNLVEHGSLSVVGGRGIIVGCLQPTQRQNCNMEGPDFAASKYTVEEQRNFLKHKVRARSFIAIEHAQPDERLSSKDSNFVYITMLREPVPRAMSHWQFECQWESHHSKHPVCNSSEAFWEHRPDNWATRQFCGYTCAHLPRGNLTEDSLNKAKRALDEMELVLTLEYLEDPLGQRLLETKLGWDTKNGSKIPDGRSVKNMGQAAHRRRKREDTHPLAELNLWDTELYQYALVKQFQAAKAVWPPDAEWTYEEELHEAETHVHEHMQGEAFKAQLAAFNKKAENCTTPCCKEDPGSGRHNAYIPDLCNGYFPGP